MTYLERHKGRGAGPPLDKVAIVTGAARGIGKVTASALASRGAHVVLADVDPLVVDTAKELQDAGAACSSLTVDVSDASGVIRAAASVVEEFGPVGVLVNNAGIKRNAALCHKMEVAAWDREIAINLNGAFYFTKAVLDSMIASGWGRIIFVSSIAGRSGLYGAAGYAATKAGMLGLMRTVALEAFQHGITSNAVCPGVIAVEDYEPASRSIRRMLSRTPGGKPGRPEDIAEAVLYLASDHAAFVNGAELIIDGGATLFNTSSGDDHRPLPTG